MFKNGFQKIDKGDRSPSPLPDWLLISLLIASSYSWLCTDKSVAFGRLGGPQAIHVFVVASLPRTVGGTVQPDASVFYTPTLASRQSLRNSPAGWASMQFGMLACDALDSCSLG